MTPRNFILGIAICAVAATLWATSPDSSSSGSAALASTRSAVTPSEPSGVDPRDLAASPAPEARTPEAPPDQSITEELPESELLDGRVLQTAYENGTLTVCGVPFDSLDIESWPQQKLLELNRAIRPLQIRLKREFMANNPTEHLFVTRDEYFAQKMWHTRDILHADVREVPDENGELHVEYGYMHVPRAISPDEYVLKDAVERIYRSPAYVEYLLAEGETYVAEVMAKHPDAQLDFTDDLTRWVMLDPRGQVVGWQSYSRFGDN